MESNVGQNGKDSCRKFLSTGSLLNSKCEQITATPTNKRWKQNLWIFQRLYVRMHALWLRRALDVPLDGINNNKAKLRDSLITISRSHLTAGAIAKYKKKKTKEKRAHWSHGHCMAFYLCVYLSSNLCLCKMWEMCTIERCHLFRVAIKLCACFILDVSCSCDYVTDCRCADHLNIHRARALSLSFFIQLAYTLFISRIYSVANIIVNCNFFHNIFMDAIRFVFDLDLWKRSTSFSKNKLTNSFPC